jgi:hypothetical protein
MNSLLLPAFFLESQQLSHALRETTKKATLPCRTGWALRIHRLDAPHISSIDPASPIILLNQWVDVIRIHSWCNNATIYTGLSLNSGALFGRCGI